MQEHQIPQDDDDDDLDDESADGLDFSTGWQNFQGALELLGGWDATRKILLRQLRLRGFRVSASARARILACTDSAELDRWVDRVLTIRRLPELFR